MYTVSPVNIELLKTILAVPTRTGCEERMVAWLQNYFLDKPVDLSVDHLGNVYVTKGTAKYFPCLVAHTDSVHMMQEVTIREDGDRITAHNKRGFQTGLGGDDKSGIFICLELIEKLDNVKAAFFVSEECGCVGSRGCDHTFFEDVGYAIQFDSPCNDIMTFTCNGVELFDLHSPFFHTVYPFIMQYGVTKWQHHPFTDVSVLKRKFDFACLNLPAGYYKMHSEQEYVLKSAVENSIQLGESLLRALGEAKHSFQCVERRTLYEDSPVKITGLMTHG